MAVDLGCEMRENAFVCRHRRLRPPEDSMKPYTLLAAVGLLGALSGLTTSASADCTPGTPGCPQLTPICPADKPACWIVPPQSIEVNAGGVSGASSWAGSSGFRPVAGSGGSASPSAGASLRPSLGGSAPQAGTGAQASWPSGGPSSAWGSEGAPLAEPTAEERRQGSDWGGVIGA